MEMSNSGLGRRKLPFGSFTLIALLIIGAMYLTGQFETEPVRQPTKPPQLTEDNKYGPVPGTEFLINHKDQLRLTDKQLSHLEEIASTEAETLPKLESEIKKAGAELNRQLDQAVKSGKDADGSGNKLPELLKEYRDARESYWKQSTSVLDKSQLATLDDLRQKFAKERLEDLKIEAPSSQ